MLKLEGFTVNMVKKRIWSLNKKALSPIFATVLLAAIIIIFGTSAYYYASNVTSSATDQLTSAISDSRRSLTERISYEYVRYNQPQLIVFIINSGSTPVGVNSLIIFQGQNIIGNFPVTNLKDTATNQGITVLSEGKGANFFITPPNLNGLYTLRVVTKEGSVFDKQVEF
jgi:flagellin-like protein